MLRKLTHVFIDAVAKQTLTREPGQCWVCGLPADSREHRLKRSDLVALHGKGPYPKNSELYRFSSGEPLKTLQSPDSKHIKYNPSLCSKCNNQVSQPHDRALEKLHSWCIKHEDEILRGRRIDIASAFSGDRHAVANILRYYSKALGCRIHDAGHAVPTQLSQAVLGGPPPYGLVVSFAVNEEMARLKQESVGFFLGRSDMIGSLPPVINPAYEYHDYFKWLTTFIGYRLQPTKGFGPQLLINAKTIELGIDNEKLFGGALTHLVSSENTFA